MANADAALVERSIKYFMQAIQNCAGSQDEAEDENFQILRRCQELIQYQLQRYSTYQEGAKDEVHQLFQQYQEYYSTILRCFQLYCTNQIQQQFQYYSIINKYQLRLYSIINRSQLFYNTILKCQQFYNTFLKSQLLYNAIQSGWKFYYSIQGKIQDQLQYDYTWQDGVEEEIQIQDLLLQLQLSMQLFCSIEQSTSFDQQIDNVIQFIQQILIQLSSVQQSHDGAGIQQRRSQIQLYSIQMQVLQLHNIYKIKRKQIIRKVLDFYVDKVVDGQKVTHDVVDQCLRNNGVRPELFIEISKIIGHSTYSDSNYRHNKAMKGKYKWNEEASCDFGLIMGKHEEYLSKLKTNRGNIKTGFWEYISFTLLSKYGHNCSPVQCVIKHKNISQNLRLKKK
ncbi:unnamed protein product [Rhizophagus irregularis]|nr:hypothetical protein RhiirB3_438202 [Rhizophagus irregularis]CAB4476860.1 unnamed protein product [Rhizophagus irregularis]CAB5384386.1 unnamed protein product [Rhizophagus irregularis]